jgi:SAM-dependent methyltransferase
MVHDDLRAAAEAEAHLMAGRLPEAEALCLTVLARTPEHPFALSLLGFVRMKQERWDEAETILRAASAFHPGNASLAATLAGFYLQRRRLGEAIEPLQRCVRLEPHVRHHRSTLVAVYEHRQFAAFSDEAKQAMLACLADDGLTHTLMSRAWWSLVRLDPGSAELLAWFASADYAAFASAATPERWAAFQGNELVCAGLRRFIVPDPLVERGVGFARRWFLEAWLASPSSPSPSASSASSPGPLQAWLPLVCTLARVCFLGEHVFATAGEDPAGLRARASRAEEVALLGCYEPLFRHPEARRLATLPVAPSPSPSASAELSFRELVRVQIHEPLKEAKIKATIPVASPIDDAISRAVQAQYEENPYPRWSTIGQVSLPAEVIAAGKGKSVLVAGCGTGREAVEAGFIFPAARVDAVDLSRTSLAYGIRQARELKAGNVFFMQGDLLHAAGLRRSYDLVIASGVLHHLREPRAGFEALLEVLRPGGALKVGLYSTRARVHVTEARDRAARAGFGPTAEGIRAFRAAVLAAPDGDPVKETLCAWDDFYTMSGCRDLVFHAEEHTFTLSEIGVLLDQLSLLVVRLDIKSPAHLAAYQQRFPDDPACTRLASWEVLEHERPNLFASMYSLWLCRADEAAMLDLGWIESTGRM